MTLKDRMKNELVEHGLWPEEADAIMEIATAEIDKEIVKVKWQDDTSGYPPQLLVSLWYSVRSIALKWIDNNCPQHFAKFMLEEYK